MRKSMAVVLGSIILTVSMVVVWPVAVGSLTGMAGSPVGGEDGGSWAPLSSSGSIIGGKRDVGQVGAYLVPTQTGLARDRTTFQAEVVEDGALKVEPLVFKNSYMVFKVKRVSAEPQESPPELKACPVD